MSATMNVEQARFNMIEQQIRPWDVLDTEVLDLMMAVRREDFVPVAHRALAFADVQIPLGHGARMLEPKVEARILQELRLRKTDKVLEIGTGSGYLAALMAAQAGHVVSVEIVPELAARARLNLEAVGIGNVTVETGDGAAGWPTRAPYDAIVVAAGVREIPAAWLEQLKVGGRLVAFVGEAPVQTAQLVTCTSPGQFKTVSVFETLLAPLANAPARGFVF